MATALVGALVLALTAANAVPATRLGRTIQTITANTLKPSSCSAITLSTTVTGTGTFSGTAAANLVLGSAAVDTITALGGNDCVLGGGGNDSIDGGAGTDVCIGGPGRIRSPTARPRSSRRRADGLAGRDRQGGRRSRPFGAERTAWPAATAKEGGEAARLHSAEQLDRPARQGVAARSRAEGVRLRRIRRGRRPRHSPEEGGEAARSPGGTAASRLSGLRVSIEACGLDEPSQRAPPAAARPGYARSCQAARAGFFEETTPPRSSSVTTRPSIGR